MTNVKMSYAAQRKRLEAFFACHALSRRWHVVRFPETILALPAENLSGVEVLLDKRAIKDKFKSFGEVVNRTDGRHVVFPATSAGKMIGASGVDVRQIASAFDRLFSQSVHAWTEPEAGVKGHKKHPEVLWYHHYVGRFSFRGEDFFVRFLVRESRCSGGCGNAVHSSTVTKAVLYKAQGVQTTDLGEDQGEAHTPFVDNKLSLFFSSVNGVNGIFFRLGYWLLSLLKG